MGANLLPERFGLVHAAVDAHTLGIMAVAQLLAECGIATVVADPPVCAIFGDPDAPEAASGIERWLRDNRITALGFSYRLDPREGAELLGRILHRLEERRLFQGQGGPLRAVYFAGLPETCERVRARHPAVAAVFQGDETPGEVLEKLGLPAAAIPRALNDGIRYDQDRLAFGAGLVRKGDYFGVRPPGRRDYPEFGGPRDTLAARLEHHRRAGLPPLMRAHVGPYLPERAAAVKLFLDWTRQLAASGHLDILSIGTSQLTQARFGEEWGDAPNGGGVPLNSEAEFAAVWQAARPMLVRSYAGTNRIRDLAAMYERTIHMAWHALSLWWFCQIDGRGPNPVLANLQEHLETLRFIARRGTPYEPNVAHHFAFRGADDVTAVVSAYLAARAAKGQGIGCLILQVMLNTPKSLWGVQDLAKARATLELVREIQDGRFRVVFQPRGGLDYFSPEPEKAKAQLAAVTALMDDVAPRDPLSPPIIHVVSYSEGSALATPAVVDESIQITRHALAEYRRLRARGLVDDMTDHPEVTARTAELLAEARAIIRVIERDIPEPYSAAGLYRVLRDGYLPVPYLWACREEFARATAWPTRLVRGAVKVVDGQGVPLPAAQRLAAIAALSRAGSGGQTA
ncbi:MAG: cobalamin-binding protein [Lentisphaeria bacterium]|jgi:hypothetical protein